MANPGKSETQLKTGTDNGPTCNGCSGTIYRYITEHYATANGEPRSDVMATCVGCLSGLRFETRGYLVTAIDVRESHEGLLRLLVIAEASAATPVAWVPRVAAPASPKGQG